MRKWWWLPVVTLLVPAGGAGWWFRQPLAAWVRQSIRGVVAVKETHRPDPQRYEVLVSDLARWRKDLAAQYGKAKTAQQRAAVEHDARVILETALPAMMRCWLGTPWDFNGTAAKPGGGRIACGYYVATVLKDAGFNLNRYRLAQQPSENILRSFLEKDACTLTIGQHYDSFAVSLETAEPGVYLIGLDTHVGFLVVGGDGLHFLHSSGSRPWCVVDEDRAGAAVVRRSNWRMVGNLTAEPAVIRRWLAAEEIAVRGT